MNYLNYKNKEKKISISFEKVSKNFLTGGFWEYIRDILGITLKKEVVQALKNISFELTKGQMIGVLGRNGSGKSTLLRVAAGVYSHESGKIHTEGIMAAIFEMGNASNIHITGRQYCHRYFKLIGISKKKIEESIEEVHQFSGLEDFFDEKILTYSAGMVARLYFSCITAHNAAIYLLDEVLCVGDELFRKKSYKRLVRLINTYESSGILATHDWWTALRICDKILVLDKGDIDFYGTSQEAVRKYLKTDIKTTQRICIQNKDKLIKTLVRFTPGKPFCFSFQIEVKERLDFTLAMTIEIPKLALILQQNISEIWTREKGIYTVDLSIPKIPILTQECHLCLFISKPRKTGEGSTEEGYDCITWTTGESITMFHEENYNGHILCSAKWERSQ